MTRWHQSRQPRLARIQRISALAFFLVVLQELIFKTLFCGQGGDVESFKLLQRLDHFVPFLDANRPLQALGRLGELVAQLLVTLGAEIRLTKNHTPAPLCWMSIWQTRNVTQVP